MTTPDVTLASLQPLLGRLVSVRTLGLSSLPNVLWVQVETESGLVGLGETVYYPKSVRGYIHESAAPYLVGQRAGDISRHWLQLYRQWCRSGIGSEARGASAIDMALWDLVGQASGLPIWQLLGGRCRDTLPIYNTCAGPSYVVPAAVAGERWHSLTEGVDDFTAVRSDPVGLARSLMDEGIRTMKIWPFDPAAVASGGTTIAEEDLQAALEPVRAIRTAFGAEMGIAIEFHNLWGLPAAKMIARALEPYQPVWLEDPLPWDNVPVVAELARSTTTPVMGSETLGSRFPYRTALEAGAIGIVATDASWVGGITEAKRVADLAAMYGRPFTHHDCSGPVNLAVGVHLSVAAETGFIQEFVRSHYRGWYAEVSDGIPLVEQGRIIAGSEPGHGVHLRPEVLARKDLEVQETSL